MSLAADGFLVHTCKAQCKHELKRQCLTFISAHLHFIEVRRNSMDWIPKKYNCIWYFIIPRCLHTKQITISLDNGISIIHRCVAFTHQLPTCVRKMSSHPEHFTLTSILARISTQLLQFVQTWTHSCLCNF